jgi:hypothetical protein
MMGLYIRGPHLGPIHTGVRVRSRRGRGDGKLGPALLALVLVGALVVASVKYWYITLPVVLVIAALVIWRYNSKPAKAARAAVTAQALVSRREKYEQQFLDLNKCTAGIRAHVRATVPGTETLAATGWHWTPDNFLEPDAKR